MSQIEPALSKEIVKLAQCCGRPGAQRGPGSAADRDQQPRLYHRKPMKESDNGKAAHEKAASQPMLPGIQKQKAHNPLNEQPQAKSGGVMSIAEYRHG